MPEKGAQDKTEKPTAKRRRKAREQGQVAKSMDVSSVGVLMAGISALWLFGGYLYNNITGLMRHMLGNSAQFGAQSGDMENLFTSLTYFLFYTVGPIWAVVSLAAIAINLSMVGFLYSPKRIKPDLKKLSPLKGLKKFVQLKMLVDVGKNVGKLVVVGFTAYLTFNEEWDKLGGLGGMEVLRIISYITGVCFKLFWRCMLAMLILALLDWAYQKWEFQRNLKMTKQEVKDELKQSEGDPKVKSRIRQIQYEQAKKRMMADVPMADVVLTNPTHLAVALAYRMHEMDAPTVLAKGTGLVAERIKEIARANEVPVIEDKPLARSLFKLCEVGETIPTELFEAVAAILAHVYRLKNKHRSILAQQPGGAA